MANLVTPVVNVGPPNAALLKSVAVVDDTSTIYKNKIT